MVKQSLVSYVLQANDFRSQKNYGWLLLQGLDTKLVYRIGQTWKHDYDRN